MSASLFMFPVRTVLDALWLPSLCGSLSNELAFSWQESNVLTERHEGRLVFRNCLWSLWSWGGIFSFLIQPRSHYSMLTSAFQMIIRWACQIAPEKSWISKIPQKQSGAKLWMFFFWPMPRNIVAMQAHCKRKGKHTKPVWIRSKLVRIHSHTTRDSNLCLETAAFVQTIMEGVELFFQKHGSWLMAPAHLISFVHSVSKLCCRSPGSAGALPSSPGRQASATP